LHWLLWRWCGQMPAPPHSLHSLLRRWCGQMPAPPHSLHLLLWRWCGQSPAPPHSLHLLLSRSCGQRLRAFLCAAPPAPVASPHRRRFPAPHAASGAAACAALCSGPPGRRALPLRHSRANACPLLRSAMGPTTTPVTGPFGGRRDSVRAPKWAPGRRASRSRCARWRPRRPPQQWGQSTPVRYPHRGCWRSAAWRRRRAL